MIDKITPDKFYEVTYIDYTSYFRNTYIQYMTGQELLDMQANAFDGYYLRYVFKKIYEVDSAKYCRMRYA